MKRALAAGDARAAADAAARAVDRFPEDPELNLLQGDAEFAAGNADAAVDAYEFAAHHAPWDVRPFLGQVRALEQLGRRAEALSVLDRFVVANPDSPDALRELALRQYQRGRFDDAIAALERALAVRPDDAATLNFLGLAVAREQGEFARGEELLRRALEINPGFEDARVNLGWVLAEQGRFEEGLALLDAAVAARPDDQETRLMRATTRLKRGDFTGWDDYDARMASGHFTPRPFRFPVWDGGAGSGGALLVFAEQGLGDQIMFASCIPDLLARVPNCVLECDPRLQTLFQRSFPAARVVASRLDDPSPAWLPEVGPVSAQIALGSLPRHFRRDERAFPKHSGYLVPDPERRAKWRARLAQTGGGLRVGLSWRGGTVTSRRSLRSLPLGALVACTDGLPVTTLSLQYGDCQAEIEAFNKAGTATIVHWPEAIANYEDTAALVAELDVVVSVCTSLVHLTGALGRPAVILVPSAPEWRYGHTGESMVWYPSVRLLRQRIPGDWAPVLSSVRADLAARVTAALPGDRRA